MDNILAAAKAVALARRNHAPLAALEVPPADEDEGYQVQRALHDLLLPHAGPLVGYKIGCTSLVMQDYIGIPHPCGGGVFQKGVHDSGVKLAAADYVRVGVECEIAVRLKRALAAGEAPFAAEWVAEAVGSALVGAGPQGGQGPRHRQWRGGQPGDRRRRTRPSPQRTRLARQPPRRRRQGSSRGTARAHRKPRQD